ncbi:uncharacterized protein LOC123692396 [Colias croceus]|uniref:uncharacterized protein LOC123692396 n=1 Tax=Colias crocea TaxID=72248 RepID=UPI001E27EB89|nr:uncharacterized protein LOC123692396 [Colias croceus]
MANRKESLRRALGISEYPWSSDDEENHENQGQNADQQQDTSATPEEVEVVDLDAPRSASYSAPPQAAVQRSQTRLERDLFWSIMNTPWIQPCAPPRPSSAYEVPSERVDLNCPVSNIQRVWAIKKLSNNLNQYNRNRSQNRPSSSGMRVIFNEAGGEGPSSGGVERIRRLARRRLTGTSRNPPERTEQGGSSRQDDVASTEEQDNAEENANHIVEVAEEPSEQERSFSPHIEEATPGENEVIEVNAALNSVRMEEEIVEIEPEGAANEEAVVNSDNAQQVENNEQSTSDGQQGRKIKRKIEIPDDDSEASSLKEINQKLLRLLECPVCLEWMEPPLSQCGRGHLLCGRCRERLSVCPICRSTVSSVRNRAMEAVTELVRYPCRHGCGREKRLRKRSAHEANCPSRLYRCPAPLCADRAPLPLADLPHHCQTRHLSMLRMGRRHKLLVRVNLELHENWLVMWNPHLFHLRLDVELNRGLYMYVSYIGPMADARKFLYEVTVQGQHCDRKLVYARATHSDLECSSLNVTRKDCFHLPFEHALNYLRGRSRACEPDRPLELCVELRPREPPADEPADS